MGNHASKKNASFDSDNEYQIIEKRPSQCVLLEHRQSKQLFIGRQLAASTQQQKLFIEQLIQAKLSKPSPYLNSLQKYTSYKIQNYCSNQQKYYVLFNNLQLTLKQQIANRKVAQQHFTTQQLLCILESSSKAIKYLRDIKHPHQNICVGSFFVNDKRQVILGDPWITPSTKLHSTSSSNYPSMQKLMHIKNGNKYCPFLSDLFSVGCLIIELWSGERVDIYNSVGSSIDEQALKIKIKQIGQPLLEEYLKILCSSNPNIRQSIFIELKNKRKSQNTDYKTINQSAVSNGYPYNFQKPIYYPLQQHINSNTTVRPSIIHKQLSLLNNSNFTIKPSFNLSKVQLKMPSQPIIKFNYLPQTQIPQFNAKNDQKQINEMLDRLDWKIKQLLKSHQQPIIVKSDKIPKQADLDYVNHSNNLNVEVVSSINFSQNINPNPITIIQNGFINQTVTEQKPNTPEHKTKKERYKSTIKQVTEESHSLSNVEGDNQLEYVNQQYDVGSHYEGYKKNGLRHGKGKFHYKEGSYYDGEWYQNRMHGYGVLYYSDGKIAYAGNWTMDQFDGKGKVYNDEISTLKEPFDYTNFGNLEQNWQYYDGELASDSRHGKGVIKLVNGQFFQGTFEKDKVNGQGKFSKMNGEVIHGIWKNNKLVKRLN